jgi:phosphoribosylanthranilate isomerase
VTVARERESCTLNSVSSPLRIKVCGITTEDAARAAVAAGADHLGLVFCASPRRVTVERAAALAGSVPASWVGVFAGSAPAEVARIARSVGLAAVQLHGSETPDDCRAVRERAGIPVWKAVDPAVAGAEERYLEVVDALLLDHARGGSGRALDWSSLAARFPRERRPLLVILAGGLDPDNVARAIREARPDGVDASSRLESAPGVKDLDLVRRFVSRARAEAEAAGDPVGAAR